MLDILECYKTLGLEPGCSPERVRNAYIQLSRFYDPNRYIDAPEQRIQAEKKKRDIDAAYQEIRHFLPELQSPEGGQNISEQNRDFNEMAHKPTTEVSRMLLGFITVGALGLLFAWAYYIVNESRLIQPTSVQVSPVE